MGTTQSTIYTTIKEYKLCENLKTADFIVRRDDNLIEYADSHENMPFSHVKDVYANRSKHQQMLDIAKIFTKNIDCTKYFKHMK